MEPQRRALCCRLVSMITLALLRTKGSLRRDLRQRVVYKLVNKVVDIKHISVRRHHAMQPVDVPYESRQSQQPELTMTMTMTLMTFVITMTTMTFEDVLSFSFAAVFSLSSNDRDHIVVINVVK
jgi:hypothetical protein